jgi:hypothetical protein
VLGALEQHSQTEAGLQEAQMKADQQSTGDLFGALGSIFGQGGGGSSLFSGLGGLFGGAAGGAAAAGAGSLGSIEAAAAAGVALA